MSKEDSTALQPKHWNYLVDVTSHSTETGLISCLVMFWIRKQCLVNKYMAFNGLISKSLVHKGRCLRRTFIWPTHSRYLVWVPLLSDQMLASSSNTSLNPCPVFSKSRRSLINCSNICKEDAKQHIFLTWQCMKTIYIMGNWLYFFYQVLMTLKPELYQPQYEIPTLNSLRPSDLYMHQ